MKNGHHTGLNNLLMKKNIILIEFQIIVKYSATIPFFSFLKDFFMVFLISFTCELHAVNKSPDKPGIMKPKQV